MKKSNLKYLFILFTLLLVNCGYSLNNYYSPDVVKMHHHQFGFGTGAQIYPEYETTGDKFESISNEGKILFAALFNTRLFYRYGLVNSFDIGIDIGAAYQSLSIRKQFKTDEEILPFLTIGSAISFDAINIYRGIHISAGLSKNNFGLTAYLNLQKTHNYSFGLTYKFMEGDKRSFIPQILVVYDPHSEYGKFAFCFALGTTFDF